MPPRRTNMIAHLLALDALTGQGLNPRLRTLLQARYAPIAGAVRLAAAVRQDGPPRVPPDGALPCGVVPIPVKAAVKGRRHG